MNEQEIIERIQKLEYHVSLLGEAIDSESHPVESLVVSMDWDRDQFNAVNNIFKGWDAKLSKGEELGQADFESEFRDTLNIDYQSLKSIIIALYEGHRWVKVCEAYVATDAGKTVELESIRSRLS